MLAIVAYLLNKMQAYLSWEELTHGVMCDILAYAVELLGGAEVLDDPHSVEGKLVVEEPVTESHGEDDAHNVEELAEAEPHVVLGKPANCMILAT